jgi:hypothetical protein
MTTIDLLVHGNHGSTTEPFGGGISMRACSCRSLPPR